MNKFSVLLKRLLHDEKGIAGLESAILLVSSVAVAGTLATTVMTSGNDASQDVDKAYTTALANIRGTYMLKGAVIGKAATPGPKGTVGQLIFSVALATSGGCVDFTPPNPSSTNNGVADSSSNNHIIVSYTDKYQHVENLYWTVSSIGRSSGDYLLEDGELFQITVGTSNTPGQNGGNLVDALATDLSVNSGFTLEVKASEGATLKLERRTPASFDPLIKFNY